MESFTNIERRYHLVVKLLVIKFLVKVLCLAVGS